MPHPILPVAPGASNVGRSYSIARGVSLAGSEQAPGALPTAAIQDSKKIHESKREETAQSIISRQDAADQFLANQNQVALNSPQAVLHRRLTEQMQTAKFQA